MNEVKVNSFLKTMAIIMLVCGILSAIVSLIGIAGVAVLAALGANSALRRCCSVCCRFCSADRCRH